MTFTKQKTKPKANDLWKSNITVCNPIWQVMLRTFEIDFQ